MLAMNSVAFNHTRAGLLRIRYVISTLYAVCSTITRVLDQAGDAQLDTPSGRNRAATARSPITKPLTRGIYAIGLSRPQSPRERFLVPVRAPAGSGSLRSFAKGDLMSRERAVFRHPPAGVGDMLKILRESQLRVIEWGSLFTAGDADAALLELGVFLMQLTGAVERAQRLERWAVGNAIVVATSPDPAQRSLFPAIETAAVAIGRRLEVAP